MRRERDLRKGIATIEMSVTLPLLVLVCFGSMNVTQMISLKHYAKLLADDIARAAMNASTDLDELKAQGEQLAVDVGISNAEFTIDHDELKELVTVKVTIPVAPNNVINYALPVLDKVSNLTVTYRPSRP